MKLIFTEISVRSAKISIDVVEYHFNIYSIYNIVLLVGGVPQFKRVQNQNNNTKPKE